MSQYTDILWSGWTGLKQMDLAGLSYLNKTMAVLIGVLFALLIVMRWILLRVRKQEYSHNYSGHDISRTYRQGALSKLAHLTPKVLFGLSLALFLVALADPFWNRSSEQVRVTNSRVRIDAKDISGSMTDSLFPGTKKSKARVAAEMHAEFVRMRRGKHDRVSLWLFGSYAHKIEDFISDDDLYLEVVEDAYWGIVASGGQEYWDNWYNSHPDYDVPRERFTTVEGESGGTDVTTLLKAVIKYYDEDKVSQGARHRSVLIISDAEVSNDPSAQLAELKKRNIIPFLILIKSSEQSLPPFVWQVEQYGGKYFDAASPEALKRAFEEIDKLESVNIQRTVTLTRVPLYQIFLLAGVALFMIAIISATIFELFGVYP